MEQLDLEGRLYLEFNQEQFTLTAQGSNAVVTLPSPRACMRVYRSLPRETIAAGGRRAPGALAAVGVTLCVCVGKRTVVSAGPGQRPSRILRTFGLPPVKVHWAGVLRSVLGI